MAITDFFVICHGRSLVHVDAISESVVTHSKSRASAPTTAKVAARRAGSSSTTAPSSPTCSPRRPRDYYDLERLGKTPPPRPRPLTLPDADPPEDLEELRRARRRATNWKTPTKTKT